MKRAPPKAPPEATAEEEILTFSLSSEIYCGGERLSLNFY